jgi:predicted transcriptional regulator
VAKKYRVVLIGVNIEEKVFRQNMARLGVSCSTLDNYIRKVPVVLRRKVQLADARKYADAIISAGGLVHIQETGDFPETTPIYDKIRPPSTEDYLVCYNCGLKQKKQDRCVRCGFDLNPPAQ